MRDEVGNDKFRSSKENLLLESRISQGRKRFFEAVKRLVKQYFVIFYVSYTRIPLKTVKREISLLQNEMK